MTTKRTAAKTAATPKASTSDNTASRHIDARIEALGDWRGETLARIRTLIHEADPDVAEEWKWRGVPVWSHAGILCTGEAYKAVVKTTFFKGASLEDPAGLFNASLEGGTRRAIDVREGDEIDQAAFKALIRAAVALNTSSVEHGRAPGMPAKAVGRAGENKIAQSAPARASRRRVA